ncbi:MAG TPA: SDR family oxidoreductase [Candidatus Acidoferrales bacterium]|nr:SDR family oxidoreductase [Candidatus Acidoferrales bacterium]
MAGLNGKLAGNWAVVTGGHVRVGRAIALALARERMNLIITYRTAAAAAEKTVAEFKALGVQAQALAVDLADAKSVVDVADRILAHSGRLLRVLVNSASVYYETPLGDISSEVWDTLLATNLRAPFLLSQRLGLAMKASGGHIVNIGDWAGIRPYRGYLPYLVSKAGLIYMTRALALELAPEVQVNCVCPGAVLLPENSTDAEAAALREETPLHRLGTPEEIANAVRYFVESEFATGSILMVDGGRLIA